MLLHAIQEVSHLSMKKLTLNKIHKAPPQSFRTIEKKKRERKGLERRQEDVLFFSRYLKTSEGSKNTAFVSPLFNKDSDTLSMLLYVMPHYTPMTVN